MGSYDPKRDDYETGRISPTSLQSPQTPARLAQIDEPDIPLDPIDTAEIAETASQVPAPVKQLGLVKPPEPILHQRAVDDRTELAIQERDQKLYEQQADDYRQDQEALARQQGVDQRRQAAEQKRAAKAAEVGKRRFLKDQGVEFAINSDGTESEVRHPDGELKFKPDVISPFERDELGQPYRLRRDDRGKQIKDFLATGQEGVDYHVDPKTGEKYVSFAKDGVQQREVIGQDDLIPERNKIVSQQRELRLRDDEDEIALGEYRDQYRESEKSLKDADEELKPLKKSYEALKTQIAEGNETAIQAAKAYNQALNKPEYVALREKTKALKKQIDDTEKTKNNRRRALLKLARYENRINEARLSGGGDLEAIRAASSLEDLDERRSEAVTNFNEAQSEVSRLREEADASQSPQVTAAKTEEANAIEKAAKEQMSDVARRIGLGSQLIPQIEAETDPEKKRALITKLRETVDSPDQWPATMFTETPEGKAVDPSMLETVVAGRAGVFGETHAQAYLGALEQLSKAGITKVGDKPLADELQKAQQNANTPDFAVFGEDEQRTHEEKVRAIFRSIQKGDSIDLRAFDALEPAARQELLRSMPKEAAKKLIRARVEAPMAAERMRASQEGEERRLDPRTMEATLGDAIAQELVLGTSDAAGSFTAGAGKILIGGLADAAAMVEGIFNGNDPSERPVLQFAKNIDQAYTDLTPALGRNRTENQLFSGLGSVAALLVPTSTVSRITYASKGAAAASKAAKMTAGIIGAGTSAASAYREGTEMGLTGSQLWNRVAANAALGATEAFGAEAIGSRIPFLGQTLAKLDKATGNSFGKWLFHVGKEGGEEYLQEGVQTFGKEAYDKMAGLSPKEWGKILKEANENALVGMAVGTIMGTFAAGVGGKSPQVEKLQSEIGSQNYRAIFERVQALRGKMNSARTQGDNALLEATKDEFLTATQQLHQVADQIISSSPEAMRAAKLAVPGVDLATEREAWKQHPEARMAAIEAGRLLRDVYAPNSAPNPETDVVVDEAIGAAVIQDLATVAKQGTIAGDRAQRLDQMGLIEIRQTPEGPVAMITDDAVALLPRGLRTQISQTPDAFRVTTTTGPAMRVFDTLVRGGEQRVLQAVRPQSSSSSNQGTSSSNTFEVTVESQLPGETSGTTNTIMVPAGSQQEAEMIVRRQEEAAGRTVKSVSAVTVFSESGQASPGETAENVTLNGQSEGQVASTTEESSAPDTLNEVDQSEISADEFTVSAPATEEGAKARKRIEKTITPNKKLLAKLGIKVAVGAQVGRMKGKGGGFSMTPSGILLIDPDRVAENEQFTEDPKEFIRQAIIEEIIHRAQILGGGKGWKKMYADIFNDPNLPQGLVEKAREAYNGFDGHDDFQKGAEIVRMVIQGKWQGTITERMYKAIENIVAYLRGLDITESELLSEAVRQTESVLKEAGFSIKETVTKPAVTRTSPREPVKEPAADETISDQPALADVQSRESGQPGGEESVPAVAQGAETAPEPAVEGTTDDVAPNEASGVEESEQPPETFEQKLQARLAKIAKTPVRKLADALRDRRSVSDYDLADLINQFLMTGDLPRAKIAQDEGQRRFEMYTIAQANEDLKAGTVEFLEAIELLGGMPMPANEPTYAGELRDIQKESKRGRRPGFFRKNAMPLDQLQQAMSKFGFVFEDLGDFLSRVNARVMDPLNKPIYGGKEDANLHDILGAAPAQGDFGFDDDFRLVGKGTVTPRATAKNVKGDKISKQWTAFDPARGSLNIPRDQMPQIRAENRGAMTQFLIGRGIRHEEQNVLPGTLKPTQAEYSPERVQKAKDFTGGDRALIVSSDNHVLDGHHQWIADLENPKRPIRVLRFNAPIRALLEISRRFPSATDAKGEAFDLKPQTPEEIAEEKARNAQEAKRQEMLARRDAKLSGGTGDMTADMFGEGETPLFNERRNVTSQGETTGNLFSSAVLDPYVDQRAAIDPVTGTPTHLHDEASFSEQRSRVRAAQLGLATRDFTRAMESWGRDSGQLDANSTSAGGVERTTDFAIEKLLDGPSDTDPAAIGEAIDRFREKIPVISVADIWKKIQSKELEYIGTGSEGTVYKSGNFVYKIHFTNPEGSKFGSGIAITDLQQDEGFNQSIAGVERVNLLDTIRKYERQALLPGAAPTEILGVTDDAGLVTKQAAMDAENDVTQPEIDELMESMGGVPISMRSYDVIPQATRRSWAVPDGSGNWLIGIDIRPGNVLRDRLTGKPFLTDGLFTPITPEVFAANPQLTAFVPERPDALFSAAPEPFEKSKDRDELIERYMPLAMSIASEYGNIPGTDPIQTAKDTQAEARKALARAARRFDESRGEFSSYAARVINNALNDRFEKELRQAKRFPVTVDQPLSDEGATLGEVTPSASEDPAIEAARAETQAMVTQAVESLPLRIREVIKARNDETTLRELADQLGISHEGVRQIQRKGLEMLRSKLREMGVTGVDGDGVLYTAAPSPFYSSMQRTIEAKIQGRSATPDQVRAIIKTAKPEEIKWSGIEQAIERIALENGGKVPKQALIEYLRNDGAVNFEEVTSTDPSQHRYLSWQLPGGVNYREVVLAMPGDGYVSRHFPDVPNYVAHMRVNERADSTGDPGLFIEEIQSDRHQDGRTKGYKGEVDVVDSVNKLTREQAITIIKRNEGGNDTLEGGETLDELRETVRGYLEQEEENENGETFKFLKNLAGTDGVADAPFRKDWPLQMFKRALRDAVASGKQWVGWTAGETQADRYNLSKQISEVRYWKAEPDGTFWGFQVIDLNGETVVMEDDYASPQKIVETLGKDIAEKMETNQGEDIGNDSRSLTGENLKVGGQGMKGFYDNILPKEIGKYVKQWGGKVEPSNLTVGDKFKVVTRRGQTLEDGFSSFQDAQDFLDAEVGEPGARVAPESSKQIAVWKVKITPEMRKTVSEVGQALFTAAPGTTDARVADQLKQIGEEADNTEAPRPDPVRQQTVSRYVYSKWVRGRKDHLDYVVPGAKDLLDSAHITNAQITAALRKFSEQMQENVKKVFGYKGWWNKGQTDRLKRFSSELLPTAARLNATGRNPDGTFVFSNFDMRAGELPISREKAMGLNGIPITLKNGVFIEGRGGEALRVQQKTRTTNGKEESFWQLYRSMPADVQAGIYNAFAEEYPEAKHWLDRWIDPALRKSTVKISGVTVPEFNRYALQDFHSDTPFGDVGSVEGYTPDVYETQSLAGMAANILSRHWTSPGRQYKSGEARERGQVKNLFEGFNTRAAQAHMETRRRELAEKLLEVSLKPIPASGVIPSDHVRYDADTLNQLLRAHTMALGLNAKEFQALKEAATTGDDGQLTLDYDEASRKRLFQLAGKVAADAARYRDHMISKEALRELNRPLASQYINNGLLRLIDAGVRGMTTGYLANPFTLMTNVFSNEIFKTMWAARQAIYGVITAPADRRESKLALREAANLVRGMLTDRWFFPGARERIDELVAPEIYNGNNQFTTIAAGDFDKSAGELFRELNVSGALLKAMKYGDVDMRLKQQLAFAAYMAHADMAADEAGIKGKDRKAWKRDWILNKAPDSVHREVYNSAVAVGLDYSNVPFWLDEGSQVKVGDQDVTAEVNLFRRAMMPFAKFPYNFTRQMKRYTVGSLLDLVKGKTRKEKLGAASNLIMMGMLFGLVRAALGDDEEGTPQIGRNYDDLGKELEGAYKTGGRVNITRTPIGRSIKGALDMFGVDTTNEDMWLRVRTLPYATPMLAMGSVMDYLANSNKATQMEAQANTMAILSDLASEGILLKAINAAKDTKNPYDRNKNATYMVGENLFDMATGRFIPPPLLRTAQAMVDPVQRRSSPVASLNYDPGFVEAVQMKIPGAATNLPPAGRVATGTAGGDTAVAAQAQLSAMGMPSSATRTYTKWDDGELKQVTSYVAPAKVNKRPRWIEAVRGLGMNVRPIDRTEYKAAIRGDAPPQ